MKTRPMLWAPESVRALLNTRPDGTAIDPAKPFKSETRRLIRTPSLKPPVELDDGSWMFFPATYREEEVRPPALAGDHLWGREAYRATVRWDGSTPREIDECSAIRYEATGLGPDGYDWPKDYVFGRYRHAHFMPRWTSRLCHEVLEGRPERLQELTEKGSLAEGCLPDFDSGCSARAVYSAVWQRLHPDAGWEKNPWVWTIRIRRIDG